MNESCIQFATELRNELVTKQSRIVLAESCTAGRVAAVLGSLPGISQWLCGSFVVYRCDSKTRWLGIPSEVLEDPKAGPVSAITTRLLADAAVKATPEARYGLAVTGEIGPGAPEHSDGTIYVALSDRQNDKQFEHKIRLQCAAPESSSSVEERVARLNEATGIVLQYASRWIRGSE